MKWARRAQRLFLPPSGFFFFLGESVFLWRDSKCIKRIWSCRFKCLEWRLPCKAFLYLSSVLKCDQSYGAGSGHKEFSCVSSQRIRDTPCKEHTGNFFPLESCTGRHRKSKIVTLSSWLPMQGVTLLLVGNFAIDLIESRTAFLCHSCLFIAPLLLVLFGADKHNLCPSTSLHRWVVFTPLSMESIWEWQWRGALYFCAFSIVAEFSSSWSTGFKWWWADVKSVHVTDWPPLESTWRQEKKAAAPACERKAMVLFCAPGGCVSTAASGDLTLWWGFCSWEEGWVWSHMKMVKCYSHGSAVRLCEASPSSQERWGHSAVLLGAAQSSVLFGGTSTALKISHRLTLLVGNLLGALQTSVPAVPLPTEAKGQQDAQCTLQEAAQALPWRWSSLLPGCSSGEGNLPLVPLGIWFLLASWSA